MHPAHLARLPFTPVPGSQSRQYRLLTSGRMAQTNRANRDAYRTVEGLIPVALVLGVVSMFGLIFPPLFFAGVTGVILSWVARRRIASSAGTLKGKTAAWIAFALSLVGCLLSLVFPAFVVYVWIYAAFHGGKLPGL